jgi:hypothetical protein
MRSAALAIGLAGIVSVAAWGQELAPQGGGPLPEPSTVPTTLGGIPPEHPFEPDPSGALARTVFATDQDANFKLTIREYSFPPGNQTRTLTLPAAAVLQNRSALGEVSVAKQAVDLSGTARVAVAPGAPIDVTNNGDRAVVLRTIIVEPK